MLADRLVPGEIIRGDEHDACAARYNLTDIGDCFLKQCRLRCQSNNQSTLLDQRNGAVLKLTGQRTPPNEYKKFPSAERSLERGGIVQPAAKENTLERFAYSVAIRCISD